jgi:hypothetical protein
LILAWLEISKSWDFSVLLCPTWSFSRVTVHWTPLNPLVFGQCVQKDSVAKSIHEPQGSGPLERAKFVTVRAKQAMIPFERPPGG